MEIEDKYTLLLGKLIYNQELNKFGTIFSIEIGKWSWLYLYLRAYYDKIDNDCIVFLEDFEKQKIKFAIIEYSYCKKEFEEYNKKELEQIKLAFGEKFSEDMIFYIEDSKRKEQIMEREERQKKDIKKDFINLSNTSIEILNDDFKSMELYSKYKKGYIEKEEMLYLIINHLGEECKHLKELCLNYFIEYEI